MAAVLALALWIAPPQPWAGVRWRSGPPTDLPRQVYALVFFASLIGAGAVGLALQSLRRRRQRTPPPTEDLLDVVAVEHEVLPETDPSRRTTGLPQLTELFMDARYGPEDPPPESVAAAEEAAEVALRDVRTRWRARGRGSP